MNLFGGKKKVVEADKVPTTVEQAIPIQEIYEDGICLVGRNLWSKTFRFTDINYEVASREDKEKMFLGYSEILNSFDSGATTKITVSNRRILRSNFEKNNMLREMGDSLDGLRYEYNMILERNVNLSTGVSQEKYMTVTVEKQTLEEARQYFNRICAEYTALFAALGSVFEEVREEEKLRIFFDFFHHGEEEDFCYDRSLTEKRGHSFKDAIAPQSMEFRSDHFKIDGRYGRVLYLKDYANFIKDSFIAELTGIDRHLMLSIDADPIPIEAAIRQGENKLLSVETNISNWQRKQNQNNNFSAAIPYDMERQRTESREFLNDLVARDQRMIPALITIVHTADTKEALDADTERIRSCARKHLCGLTILRWQQLEGLNSCLPYGCRKLGIRRTLTTESLAVFMPFRVQEICHSKGIYLGNNAISKNPIIVNRSELLNGNSFILGVSGSGKSMLAKQKLVNIYLSDSNADIFVIDPEREMTEIVNTLGGENIKLSAASENHINALDMSRDYGDGENPLILKSEFMLSLCRDIVGNLGAKEKSIIDRCTSIVYRDYLLRGCVGEAPTMKAFYDTLLAQDELEAKELALALELYINGNLNIFAKPTNVNLQSRLVCYDIHGLGEELMSPSMRIVLDSIYNRVTSNKAKGRKTYIFIDEIYILFAHEHSAQFLHKLWRRVRKAGGYVIGVTQNVEDLLDSPTAKFMLANSEYVIMLNQAATDRMRLAEVMKISESQMAYFTNTEAGHGLAKIGGAFVPFVNKLPKDTELYRMMTTKFGE